MAKKCKSCQNASVGQLENVPVTEAISAVVTVVAIQQVDKMLTTNQDGTPKDNVLAKNPMLKNVGYVVLGAGVSAYMEDPISQGVAMGAIVQGAVGAVNQLMDMYMTGGNGTAGVYGNGFFRKPTNIGQISRATAAPRTGQSASGVLPTNIGQQSTMTAQQVSDIMKQKMMQQAQDTGKILVVDEGLSAGM